MSFSHTVRQCRARTKTVTRRMGWWNLKIGERILQVEKSMGMKYGEQQIPIHTIEILNTRPEPLTAITDDEVALEGFPGRSRDFFIKLFLKINPRVTTDPIVNRIEFKYID